MHKRWVLLTAFISGSILFLLLPVISSPDFSTDLSFLKIRPFQHDFLSYVLVLCYFYLHYYLLIPQFYFRRRWFLYGVLLCSSYVIVHYVPGWVLPITMQRLPQMSPFPGPPPAGHGMPPLLEQQHVVVFFTVTLFSLMLRIYSRWKEMEQEKSDFELRYLKAQINPHFLFNTLNVIYASSIEEKARKTTGQLQRLSDMLRYVLTDAHNEWVTVQDELNYIRSYIALQDDRNARETEVTIHVADGCQLMQLPPLVLIPFIENAYKYGISPVEKSNIRIRLEITQSLLTCEVENTIVKVQHHAQTQHGIGVKNTLQRLNHLFPGQYLYKVLQTDQQYLVHLQFPLRK